jgi:hypothetical protein
MPRATNRPATIILDCEAIQALKDVDHSKHSDALAVIQVVNDRRRRRPDAPRVVAPVAARVEAGWDRSHRSSAHINWLTRAVDWPLTTERADQATRIRVGADVSAVDATIGQAADECPKPVTIVTSDVEDMIRLAGGLRGVVRVAPL